MNRRATILPDMIGAGRNGFEPYPSMTLFPYQDTPAVLVILAA